MKKLPEQVKINGYIYTVKYDDTLSEEGLMGRIQLLHGVIDLRPGMSHDMELTTLMHEVGHGYLFHGGMKEHDERHLDMLSSGFLTFVRDNPGILK